MICKHLSAIIKNRADFPCLSTFLTMPDRCSTRSSSKSRKCKQRCRFLHPRYQAISCTIRRSRQNKGRLNRLPTPFHTPETRLGKQANYLAGLNKPHIPAGYMQSIINCLPAAAPASYYAAHQRYRYDPIRSPNGFSREHAVPPHHTATPLPPAWLSCCAQRCFCFDRCGWAEGYLKTSGEDW